MCFKWLASGNIYLWSGPSWSCLWFSCILASNRHWVLYFVSSQCLDYMCSLWCFTDKVEDPYTDRTYIFLGNTGRICHLILTVAVYYAPAIFNGCVCEGWGGGAYNITAVLPPVRPVHPVRNTNGFQLISFEKISVLDRHFIHRYIIIKCRLISIKDKIHQLLWELWPFFNFENWFPFDIFWKD